ncbi:BRO-N domain-containing protein [Tyzzerella sp. An114]|uniref:BRO-N domain-containing protein n=1 Tax=Tyzzerella sp. An114 TaxID=1965545 RepID=UPI000B438AA3|nr:BRO family protein [Tyzzerella sp. An114]
MNKLQVFKNENLGEIRTIIINNEVWFVGKDVARILGYAKPENAISTYIDNEDKTTTLIQGIGSNYKSKAVIINESGLYSLILSSKLPKAKEFKRWVTSEILPQIRKNGYYSSSPEDFLKQAILEIVKQIVPEIINATKSTYQNYMVIEDDYEHFNLNKNKIEYFPNEIRENIDEMLLSMQECQKMNFSLIARYCSANGYCVSSPTVKKYFERNFEETETGVDIMERRLNKKYNLTPFGKKVKKKLLDKNMTITELSEAIGYKRPMISRVLYGDVKSEPCKKAIENYLELYDTRKKVSGE